MLARAGIPHALVGGLAVSVRTEPRFTRDVDIVVAVADDDAVTDVVRAFGPSLVVQALLEHDRLGRLAAVRLGAAGGDHGPVLDLLMASSGIEPEIAAAAELLEVLPGVRLPVARVGHLIALKLLSRDASRPQDEVDLHALRQVADAEETALAEEAVRLITARGADRDRDLVTALRQLITGE